MSTCEKFLGGKQIWRNPPSNEPHDPDYNNLALQILIRTKYFGANGVMLITVDKEVEEGKIPEWNLIEFQGKFSCMESEEKNFFNKFVGDLNYTKDGVPFFLNGHHVMYGEEVKLKKPLAVLYKTFEDESVQKSYVVKAVIRRKLRFVKRPKPVIPNDIPMDLD